MDPHSVDTSLQKISPQLDPAAAYRLSTEVSAQANVLVAHQQQLACHSSLSEELVTTLHYGYLHLSLPRHSRQWTQPLKHRLRVTPQPVPA